MFDIVFTGQIKPNMDIKIVKTHIANLLKLDASKMQVLFSGKKTVIKSNIDKETALKYQKAFAQRGAILHILAKNNDIETPTNTQSTQPKTNNSKTIQEDIKNKTIKTNLNKLEIKADDPYKAAFMEVEAFDFGLKNIGETLSSEEKEEEIQIENKAFAIAPQGSDMKEINNKEYEEIKENNFLKI